MVTLTLSSGKVLQWGESLPVGRITATESLTVEKYIYSIYMYI
jgi:hypothetical protein